jgi:gliding motility-associated transport system permease protein
MRATLTIAEREIRAYFTSPIGFVVLAGFLLISSIFFLIPLASPSHVGSFEAVLPNMTIWLIFLIPALTMRLVAEEKRSGSIELLATSPVTDFQIVLGKYLGVLAFYGVILAATLQYVFGIAMVAKPETRNLIWPGGIGMALLAATLVATVVAAANPGRRLAGLVALTLAVATLIVLFLCRSVLPEKGPLITGYMGLFLMGAAFIAIGLLTSTVTRNQIVAYVVAVVVLLGMVLLSWLGSLYQENWLGEMFNYLSIPEHLTRYARGVLDTRDIFLYLTWIAVSLFLSVRALATGKWK